ncbi:MAG: glycosyltransferase [Desulfobacterales bacterium]|jgi:GT2 family glycosyltransferase
MSKNCPATDKIQLSVIVLFYYGEQWIHACLASLENQTLPRTCFELILADNGGSTPSVEKYAGKPNTKVLRFDKNYGFAGGNNRALQHAAAELVLLMNQDVVVHTRCLEELLTAFHQNPQAGVISANMLMVSQKDEIDPLCVLPEMVGFYRLSRLGYAVYGTRQTKAALVPIEFASGNALGFRKRILAQVGNYLFDDRLGSYAEDLDLSIRMKKTRWKMFLCQRAVVCHYRDEAFTGGPLHRLQKLFHVSSNRLLVYYKNLSLKAFLLKLPGLALGIPFKVSRKDGDPGFKIINFFVALGFLPLIIGFFVSKQLRLPKINIGKDSPA